jgi:hypothetical protein
MSNAALKAHAHKMVEDLLKHNEPPAFVKFNVKEVAHGLAKRIDRPEKIKQGPTGLCGPASLVFNLALHHPDQFVRLVGTLLLRGGAHFGKWHLKPSEDLKQYRPDPETKIDPADWIALASFRDSANWFFDYQSTSDMGGTKTREIVSWMEKAGYTKFEEDCNVLFCKDVDNLMMASTLFGKDYNVILGISSALLKHADSTWSVRKNHFVALASKVMIAGDKVHLTLFSWGRFYNFPKDGRDLELKTFLAHYYGYIACLF